MKILEILKNQKEDSSFNFLPDGIFTLEQDGKIVDVNNKVVEIFQTTRFNILGRYFSDFIENGTAILNKIVKENSLATTKALLDDNKSIYLEISATRIPETSKVYVAIRDVTERQIQHNAMCEKYNVAQKIVDGKNDFLLDTSGAILSNLISMSGFSRALLDGIAGELTEKQEKYLNIINQNARFLSYDLEKLFALFKLESKKFEYRYKAFDLISLIKSIERVYEKDFKDRKIIFSLDYSNLSQRDCLLDGEIVEYILRCIMDIFLRFSNLGKCSLNIGACPMDFFKDKDFAKDKDIEAQKYVLFEAKIGDLIFNQDELDNIFDTYYKGSVKRPIGLKASLSLLKMYITDFKGDIWVYSKPNFGTMFTFVLPLK